MTTSNGSAPFHYSAVTDQVNVNASLPDTNTKFDYVFENFFHPFVGDLISQLNKTSIRGMLDPDFLQGLKAPFDYTWLPPTPPYPPEKNIDISIGGPYANYNWELLFHIPVMVAVHLSKNQRFAEAQKWFHYVFDPTSTDTKTPAPDRFWKFLAFRNTPSKDGNESPPPYSDIQNIHTLLNLLSTDDSTLTLNQRQEKNAVLEGYKAMLQNPFQPHVIARTRPGAYQWYVVMQYLDNLIAWGDNLFMQDTIETINEATLCYVLAANILGPRPQALPLHGVVKPKNFLQMKQAGLDAMGNAMVDLEGQFPFNMSSTAGQANNEGDQSGALFGIGRTLYFCVPNNSKLLTYWDTIADRLFKIRNSENINGVVQQLPLFDPPIDPGLLVKAAAAGLDIGSIISGLNQPLGPLRAPLLIQKALELAGEVRSLGNALLTALEKQDAERLALIRQGHEITLHQLSLESRFLQWKSTQEATKSLLTNRATAMEKLRYYQRLLGLPSDANAPDTLVLDQASNADDAPKLTKDNFDEAYGSLVGQYDKKLTLQSLPGLNLAGDSSPGSQSGFSGNGKVYLSHNEDVELNTHLPAARDLTALSSLLHSLATPLFPVPDANINMHFWGLGGTISAKIGDALVNAARIVGDLTGIHASWERDQAGMAGKYASYERRADDWLFQYNLAAHDLMQVGRQILTSMIAEQVAQHEYQMLKKQLNQAQEIQEILGAKFTNVAFYEWQASELTGLYYQYYRFACDIARKAEQTMKRELMRPVLDSTDFIQFNYWDSGYKGLLSGEALVFDIKRMEMAYHDNNKRELELTRHVSLQQLDPLALLQLKTTGTCVVDVPEWLYDLDSPGLYMRRIKSVAVSVPCIVGPYTSINCTLSLQKSTLRVSPLLTDGNYARETSGEDNRFVDYYGAADVIVTSNAVSDSGMFETNLKDERFLPFEGAGAISTWNLSLPQDLKSFDYMTISDVILHIRYTARQAGDPLGSTATKELKQSMSNKSSQALMFCLPYDFSTEWAAFVANNTADLKITLRNNHFPYLVQNAKQVNFDVLTLYTPNGDQKTYDPNVPGILTGGIGSGAGTALLTLPSDPTMLTWDATTQVFLLIQYHLL